MALSIVNNSTAIGAQGSVNSANNQLAKTIKALSTGLRINSAADDASGLAVSEKLRGQISGLSKAATNAQDAISMLQTAEGAMGSMTSMVQRIRELAVQAGDPAYTTNDRAMLQLEVDQLKEEIDRVSTSTEFNTKKLLNGDASALWSSSNSDIEAIIKGTPAEGNYKIEYSVDPGQNSVYKSQIMSLANGNSPMSVASGTSAVDTASFRGINASAGFSLNVTYNNYTSGTTMVGGTSFTGGMTIEGGTTGYFIEASNGSLTVRDSATGEILGKQSVTATSGTTVINAGDAKITFQNSSVQTAAGAFNNGLLLAVGENFAGTNSLYSNANGTAVLATNLSAGTRHEVAIAKWTDNGAEYGTLTIDLKSGATASTATITLKPSAAVDKNTKLSDLAQFTNADGRMILDNTQELSIYAGNGKKVSIFIEGSDTIANLESKLSTALSDLGLGDNPNTVRYVTASAGTSNAAVPGTFIIQGAVLGSDSNLSFVGDQSLISALGIQQIQEAKDSAVTVTVKEAHTGRPVGADTVTDGRVRDIIQGVDLDINPEAAYNVKFDNTTFKMTFTPTDVAGSAMLHITDNSTKAAIGANEGQTLDISIGRLDTKSLNIEDVNVATFDDAQKAITKLDMALEQISKARATAGAQMNRLEYTISNLNTTRENMVASESRIRDLDIAQASSDLTAQQVVLQSATAMLAQANQIPSYAMQLLG